MVEPAQTRNPRPESRGFLDAIAAAERAMIRGMSNTLFDDDTTIVPTPTPPRTPNPIWDALSEWFGEPATRSEQTLRGRIVSSLNGAGATPQLVHERCHAWSKLFPGATLTQTALERHWTQLGLAPLQTPADFARRGHEGCLTCGGSGFTQTYSPSAGMVDIPCTETHQ